MKKEPEEREAKKEFFLHIIFIQDYGAINLIYIQFVLLHPFQPIAKWLSTFARCLKSTAVYKFWSGVQILI